MCEFLFLQPFRILVVDHYSLVSDTSRKFFMARSIAMALKTAAESGLTGNEHTENNQTFNAYLNMAIDPELWDTVTHEAKVSGAATTASWSPFIADDAQRREFEAFAVTQTIEPELNPPCFLCGSPDLGYTNPEALVNLPSGPISCAAIDYNARIGEIAPQGCSLLAKVAPDVCNCGEIPEGTRFPEVGLPVPGSIFGVQDAGPVNKTYDDTPALPLYQTSSLDWYKRPTMYNQLSEPVRRRAFEAMKNTTLPVLSEMYTRTGPYYHQYASSEDVLGLNLLFPIYDKLGEDIHAVVTLDFLGAMYFTGVFPADADLVDVVVANTCGQEATFKVETETNTLALVAMEDVHDPNFEEYSYSSAITDYDTLVESINNGGNLGNTEGGCRYHFHAYATDEYEDAFISNSPALYACATAAMFVLSALFFILYDLLVRKRQDKILTSAKQTSDMVSDMYPKTIRDRMRADMLAGTKKSKFSTSKSKLITELGGTGSEGSIEIIDLLSTDPIADYFPVSNQRVLKTFRSVLLLTLGS